MNDSPHIDPPVPDYPTPSAKNPHWPLSLYCSRVEQLLLLALRLLTASAAAHDKGMGVLAALRLSNDGQAAFNKLRQLLGSSQWRIRLLGAGSSQVCMDELDLLACLNRLSRAQSIDSPMAIPGIERPNALLLALHQCAAAMREAGMSLRQRTLPLSGRRFIEHELAGHRPAASHALCAAHVARVEQLSADMRRVTIAGADMRGYIEGLPAQWVKLFAATADGARGAAGRAYTIRHYRPEANEIDIDCVLHDSGPMSRWAAGAEAGQVVHVSGVRGGYPMPLELPWLVLAGDASALPAIATILEAKPGHTAAHVFLELDEEADLRLLPASKSVQLRWTTRGGPQHTAEPKLLALIREATLPRGMGQIWMAGEAPTARLVRNHLLIDRLLPAKRIHSVGYWKRGEQDHKDKAAG